MERSGTPTPISNPQPAPGLTVEDVDNEHSDNRRESKKAKASVAMSERLAHIRAKTKQVPDRVSPFQVRTSTPDLPESKELRLEFQRLENVLVSMRILERRLEKEALTLQACLDEQKKLGDLFQSLAGRKDWKTPIDAAFSDMQQLMTNQHWNLKTNSGKILHTGEIWKYFPEDAKVAQDSRKAYEKVRQTHAQKTAALKTFRGSLKENPARLAKEEEAYRELTDEFATVERNTIDRFAAAILEGEMLLVERCLDMANVYKEFHEKGLKNIANLQERLDMHRKLVEETKPEREVEGEDSNALTETETEATGEEPVTSPAQISLSTSTDFPGPHAIGPASSYATLPIDDDDSVEDLDATSSSLDLEPTFVPIRRRADSSDQLPDFVAPSVAPTPTAPTPAASTPTLNAANVTTPSPSPSPIPSAAPGEVAKAAPKARPRLPPRKAPPRTSSPVPVVPKGAPAPAQAEPTEPIPLFNFKPAKGIAAMIAAGLVEDRPEAIAQVLVDNKELQARYVGLYLSDPSEKATAVREAFGALVINESFRNLGFVDALREYLSRFVMPGEAAQIERILATFAVRFYSLNGESNGFANSDAAHILAFSVIMLNTDLHNPAVKKKMTFVNWVNSLKGSADLPEPFLKTIYNEIQKNPLKFPTG